jgi:cytochrome oxidase Cu insertion factor (SCO1/SenC/PrrC family)
MTGADPTFPRSAHDRRQRRILIVVGLIFFAPLGFSFYLYYGHGTWRPGGRVNSGELVHPARPLPGLALPLATDASRPAGAGTHTQPDFLHGKWTLLYLQRGNCDEQCRRHLYDTRQIRLALDREMNRVQRVFIGDADCCDMAALRKAHPDLIAIVAGPEDDALLALLPQPAAGGESHRIYLIDPLGNLMMFYEPEGKPKGILEDMKRLLRLSSIG